MRVSLLRFPLPRMQQAVEGGKAAVFPAQGDPLGRCCLTPYGYSHMTHQVEPRFNPSTPLLPSHLTLCWHGSSWSWGVGR